MTSNQNIEQRAIEVLGEPLEVTTRGDWVENVHSGHVAVVSSEGKIIAHAGDPGIGTIIRSTAKPFQAIPSVLGGIVEKYGLPDEAIALMTASHRGTPRHLFVLERMLELTGVDENDLVFAETMPADPQNREEGLHIGVKPRKLFHVCAGKHIAMLALCKLKGWPPDSYTDPGHPLQQELLATVASYAGLPLDSIGLAVDGCGLPVFALPLWRLAFMYARLSSPSPEGVDSATKAAAARITAAMNNAPDLVEGYGRLASVMLADDNVIAKSGAQGVFVFALRKEGIAVALKLADGGESAWPGCSAAVLEQLHAGADVMERINNYFSAEIYNSAGQLTGRREPSLRLKFH
ncbi:asparaginase [Paenibacillus nasutitermitis]|uniref:Asparaginase n=1 Tax=Paenibacillus nasutitermitis TaxID=1652958 RepID=A0A916Z4R0_9BACL|nr:asparaginase [Paenibacillus nasutitermitis]GGD75896.1 asparaginase [Paenibacillus nasutitermitis]